MPRYDDDYDDIRLSRYDDRASPREMPQSGLGIASLFIAIVMGLGLFALIAVATVITLQKNGQVADNDPLMAVVGLGILGGCGLSLIGLVLGIIGSMQPDRKSLCGILGSVFNAIILLGVGGLICLGLIAG